MMKTSENYTFSNCDLDSNSVVSKCIISPVTHREKFFRIRVEISPEIKVEDDMLRKSMLLVEPESTHTGILIFTIYFACNFKDAFAYLYDIIQLLTLGIIL